MDIFSNEWKRRNGTTRYVIIPIGTETIPRLAFDAFQYMETATMPNTVKNIGDGAFMCCYSLKNVRLSEKLEEIGMSAFAYCKALESITIPASVKRIGENAFYGCENLKSISCENPNVLLEKDAIPEGVVFC